MGSKRNPYLDLIKISNSFLVCLFENIFLNKNYGQTPFYKEIKRRKKLKYKENGFARPETQSTLRFLHLKFLFIHFNLLITVFCCSSYRSFQFSKKKLFNYFKVILLWFHTDNFCQFLVGNFHRETKNRFCRNDKWKENLFHNFLMTFVNIKYVFWEKNVEHFFTDSLMSF